eukprot:4484740-Amphidinium_carterae.1
MVCAKLDPVGGVSGTVEVFAAGVAGADESLSVEWSDPARSESGSTSGMAAGMAPVDAAEAFGDPLEWSDPA